MKYRTVPVYPAGRRQDQQGDRAHRHQAAGAHAEAMKQAQAEAIQDLQKAGIKVDLGPRVASGNDLLPTRRSRRRSGNGAIASTASSPAAWRRRWRCWRSSRCCRRFICWPPASRRSTSRGPRRCGISRSRCENYHQLLADDALPQLGLGAGQALVLDGAAAAPDRPRLRPAAQHAHRACSGAAHRVPDPDGAAADRRRHHLEGDLHARHQPACTGSSRRSAGTCRR